MFTKEMEIKSKIANLKYKLRKTDYQAIKYAEGALSLAEYSETMRMRESWRAEINVLENQLKVIGGKVL